MLHKTQKAPTQTHKKARPNTTHQASQAHELRKGCAALPHSPFAIRGAWGDWSPHKKNAWGDWFPHKKLLGTKSAILTLFMRWHFGRPYFVGKEHNGEDHYIDGTGT